MSGSTLKMEVSTLASSTPTIVAIDPSTRQLRPDAARICTKSPLPEAVAQDHDATAAGLILRKREGASERCSRAEHLKKSVLVWSANQLLRMSAVAHVDIADAQRPNVLPGRCLIFPNVQLRL
jgi:hypothetical protein